MNMTGNERYDEKGNEGKAKGLGQRVSTEDLPPKMLHNLNIVTGSSLETKSAAGKIGHTAQWP